MDDEVTSSVVARALGIDQRTVNRLADRGVLTYERDGRGYRLFDLQTAAREFAAYRSPGPEPEPGEVDWGTERKKADTRIKRAQADMLEIKRNEMFASYHRAEYVADATGEILRAVRLELTGLPDRLAPALAAIGDQAEASAAIKREIVATLERLAGFEYQPGQYREPTGDQSPKTTGNQSKEGQAVP